MKDVDKLLKKIYYDRLNIHLELLHKAVQDKDEKMIEFQKSQLKIIREALYNLKYFR